MEFDIDIHTGLNGKITIEDYSQEYDQYFPENQITQEYGRYKYSECKTLNVIMKIDSGKITLVASSLPPIPVSKTQWEHSAFLKVKNAKSVTSSNHVASR